MMQRLILNLILINVRTELNQAGRSCFMCEVYDRGICSWASMLLEPASAGLFTSAL
uniref:Uncharacterized protein n=1 Tax=Picea glauca TaxID=3330 RepID=A0A101M2L8_PICGL|nr:hypothetical protein ABT39_MTgene3010 [Picea glauca]